MVLTYNYCAFGMDRRYFSLSVGEKFWPSNQLRLRVQSLRDCMIGRNNRNLQANICLVIGITILCVSGVYLWAYLLQFDKLSVLSIVTAAVIITTILLAYMVFNESWGLEENPRYCFGIFSNYFCRTLIKN